MLDWLRTRIKGRSKAGADGDVQSLYDSSQFEEASRIVESRLDEDPNDAEALYVQGLLQFDDGQAQQAMFTLRRAVQAQPNHVDAWVALARAYLKTGSQPGADEALAKARALAPDHPQLLVELALQALARRQPDEAHALLAQLRSPVPRSAEPFTQLAVHMLASGRTDIAQRLLRRAVEANPRHVDAQAGLGAVLREQGLREEAISHLQAALALQPAHARALFNLGMLRLDQDDPAGAVPLLEQAVAADPNRAETRYRLGQAQMAWGDHEAARQAFHAAVRLQADHVEARWGETLAQLPSVAPDAAGFEEGLLHFRQELARLKTWFAANPAVEGHRAVGTQRPLALAASGRDCTELLRQYGQLCESLMAAWGKKSRLPPPDSRASSHRLRLGIVSAHVHSHPVWDAVLRGWLAHLPRDGFELHLFYTGAVRDEQTAWAESRVASLRQGVGDWTAWAHAVASARCDVLLYPEVGLDETTFRLAALRLARLQVAGRGLPVTTGLPTIDAYASAEAMEPPSRGAHYTEQLLMLPRLGCAYQPPGIAPQPPDLAAWGVAAGDRVLVCAGQPAQYAPADDKLWTAVAQACQPCKLLFFARPGDLRPQRLEQRLRRAFGEAGVDFEATVRFVPWQSRAAFLGLLQRADQLLDPIGSSNINTAMDSVAFGTPNLAWDGSFQRGRLAGGILRELGLEACVAADAEEYVGIARGLSVPGGAREAVVARLRQGCDRLYGDQLAIDEFAGELERLATSR
jgi:predicted O-linked N-acetylglucosamine transferase (SPINDLY family)